MGTVLGELGLAWPRLLLYPGGLTALLLAVLCRGVLRRRTAPQAAASPSAPLLALVTTAAPLLANSLLPLPHAVGFRYLPDLPTLLGLLEWPYVVWLAQQRSSSMLAAQQRLLVGYALLIAAVLALATGSGSFALEPFAAQVPASAFAWALLVAGTSGWVVALVGLEATALAVGWTGWGLHLRLIGHVLLASLPWFGWISGFALWAALLPPLVIGAAVVVGTALWSWAQWQRVAFGAIAVLAGLLAWGSYLGLAARLE